MTRDEALTHALEESAIGPTNNTPTGRDSFLEALAASGFAIVPVEATDAMVLAALDRHQRDDEVMHASIWRAMLAAALAETEETDE